MIELLLVNAKDFQNQSKCKIFLLEGLQSFFFSFLRTMKHAKSMAGKVLLVVQFIK